MPPAFLQLDLKLNYTTHKEITTGNRNYSFVFVSGDGMILVAAVERCPVKTLKLHMAT